MILQVDVVGFQILTERVWINLFVKISGTECGGNVTAQHLGIGARDENHIFLVCQSTSKVLPSLDVLYLIEEEDVEGAENGRAAAQAVQSEVIERLNRGLQDILENLFLSDLEQKYQEYSEYSQDMYYI